MLPLVHPAANRTPASQAAWLPELSTTVEAVIQQTFITTSGGCRDADPLRPTITDGCYLIEITEELFGEPVALPAWEEPALAEDVVDAAPPAPDEPVAVATPVSAGGLSWPALGRITSVLGAAHPMGLDIAMDSGQPVFAAGDGRVAFAGWNDDYGNHVLINHPGGYTTRYAHFLRPASVRTGEQVRRGQIIGFAGNTGKSDGPHLHFEVHLRNLLVDPLKHLPRIALVYDLSAYRAPSPSATPTPTPTPTLAVRPAESMAANAASWPAAGASTPAPAATVANLPAFTPATPAPPIARTATATVAVPVQTPSSTPTPVVTQTPTPTPTRPPATATPSPTPAPTPPPPPAASNDNPGSAPPPPN